MGHAEEDCYLKKINAKKEQKNADGVPVVGGLHDKGLRGRKPLKVICLPVNPKSRRLPIVGLFFNGYYAVKLTSIFSLRHKFLDFDFDLDEGKIKFLTFDVDV
jgi:hypothetical protein